ncbi:proton-coupled folate transporter-like [Paramacrobiotus metropolitanus]|uniref:proton-coupled folate transporter-like n=1 Tax=Paramacrobiotus metropolitanus TaxID=2943436 RepID=UPI002446232A|nr:proton-coupled folate transporter-like [Paramacrobiotus metropolitanus]
MNKLSPYRPSAVLSPAAFLFGLQFGIIGPVLTELIKLRVCAEVYQFPHNICVNLTDGLHQKKNDLVSSSTAHYIFLEKIGVSLPSLLFAVFTGSWSDHFGHKRAILIPTFGMLLGGIILTVLAYVPTHPAAFLLFSLVQTSLGGFAMAGAALYSYLGDHCNPTELAANIAIFDGTMFLSGSIAELSCGVLYRTFGFPFPIILYTMCFALAISYIALAVGNRAKQSEIPAKNRLALVFTTQNLKANKDLLVRDRIGGTSKHILLLIISAVIGHICVQGAGSIQQLFFETAPLNWKMENFAMLLAMSDIIGGIFMMIGVPFLIRMLQLNDFTVGTTGILSTILSFIILSMTTKTWMAFIFVIIGAPCRMQFTAIRSLLSNLVDAGERGKMMSIIAAYEAVMPLFGSFVFATVFSVTVFWWSGFSFAFGAVVMVVPLVIFRYIAADRREPMYNNTAEFALLEGVQDEISPHV